MAIELLSGFADNVLALRASGRITHKDYQEILIPAAEKALRQHEKLRVYYEVGADFTGFDAGAMWADMSLGVTHLTHWERIALVTDVAWMKYSVEAFRIFMPFEVKVFSLAAAAEAKSWLSS